MIKRVVSAIICIFMLMTSVSAQNPSAEKPDWNKMILDADFENVRSLSDYGFQLEAGSGHSETITEKDKEHGKSLLMKMPSSSSNLMYALENGSTESILIRFSYFREGTEQLLIFRHGSDEMESVSALLFGDSKARFSFFSYEGRVSLYPNERSYARPVDDEAYMPEKIGDWNDVAIYFDYPHSEVSYFINNRLIQTKEVELANFHVFGITLNKGSDIWLDNISVCKLDRADLLGIPESGVPKGLWKEATKPVEVELDSGLVGNIYSAGDATVMKTRFTERNGKSGNYKVAYELKDEYDRVVWTGSDSFSVRPYESYSGHIKPDLEKFGCYWLYVTVVSDSGETYECFTQLSKANLPPKGFVNKKFGMNLHVGQGRPMDEQLDILIKAGVGVVRDGWAWWKYQKRAGDAYTFPEEEVKFIKKLAENDITYIAGMSPGLPEGMGAFGTESFLKGYEEWAYQLAKHFKEAGLDYALEVYNEWNHSGTLLPEDYAEVQKAMYKGAKRADPDAIVVGGCTSGVPGGMYQKAFDKMNGEVAMDAMSFHIYDYTETGPEASEYVNGHKYFKSILDSYGYTDMPIWLTEVGWSVSPGHATQSYQNRYLPRLLASQDAYGLYDIITLYDFVCDGVSPDLRESNFGIVESYFPSWEHPMPMAARGSYLAYTNFNALNYNAEFVEILDVGKGIHCYRYKKSDGKDMLFMVAGGDDRSVGLRLGCDSVKVYDMYGNAVDYHSVDGVFSFYANKRPIYIEGNFGELTSCESVFDLVTNKITVAAGSRADITVSKTTNKLVELTAKNGGNAYVTDVGSFETDQTMIDIGTKTDADGEDIIETEIRIDGKPVYTGITDVVYSPSVSVQSFAMEPSSVLMDFWTGTLRLKSNQSDLTLDGKLTFTYPDFVAEKMGVTEIKNIIPGAVKSVPLNMSGDMVGQQVKLRVDLNNGETVNLTTRLSSDAAHYAYVKPVIDGKTEKGEWNLSHKTRVRSVDSSVWFDVAMMWDEEYLYFYGLVKDQYFIQQQTLATDMWRQDSIQVAFSSKEDSLNFTELGFAQMPDGPAVYSWYRETGHGGATGVVDDIDLAVSRINAENTLYEARIPWSSIVTDTARISEGNTFKFDVCLNNDDAAGRVYVEYGYGIASSKDITKLSPVLLVKDPQ